MKYLGQDIKKLGFGLMRLPQKDGKIDIEDTKKMVDIFMEAGFTYFDTAFVYDGSEEAARKVLVERYPRESYQLATKNAAWIKCKTREDAIRQFRVSLERTGAGYFDFYLLHSLGEAKTKVFDELKMWDFVKEKKEEGLIKHIGFSFHSTAEELDRILTDHPEAEFVQLQINYADWDNPDIQSRACYEVARKHNKPVIIMEPVKGGLLANPPKSVAEVFDEADKNASYSSWAIRFAANLDGVITVLSGMSSIEQMRDNISYMKDFSSLSDSENAVIEKAQKAINSIPIIPCTTCNYCAKVCPKDIAISATFTATNHFKLYNNISAAKRRLDFKVSEKGLKNASECIKCGACEEVCPQHLKIRALLDEADKIFN